MYPCALAQMGVRTELSRDNDNPLGPCNAKYRIDPVADINEAAQALQQGVEFRKSIG